MEERTPRQIEEDKMVEQAYQHLVDTYIHSPHHANTDMIQKAFNFARQAHAGVRRLSGEPYIMHPIAVAQIACQEIGLGSTSICAALLHDVVEDTDYSVEDIANIFNPKIAQIVDGLTKISGGIFGEKASKQAESFKKLLLTMSDDIRVLLIKIADRLHNMRTLGSQLPNKQYKIAGETLYIYAPLASRVGLNKVKEELEDLSFRYEHPEEYAEIQKRITNMRDNLKSAFEEFTAPIRAKLDAQGFTYDIKARIKSPYSIWRKMQAKHLAFEEIYDILAARIIFQPREGHDDVSECFQVYALVSNIYRPHPERFRDWLTHPKANGYKALHTTLMSHLGKWVEVQIRSQHMDEVAEHGFASHWKYKEGERTESEQENELNKWLHTIKEILDDPQPNAVDFLDAIKLNLYASEIFVVTPKGEFKTMPAGCTVLDFAFSIHTFLGTHCIGAKVNHKLSPISHILNSGDQVEILTSKTQKVTEEWLQHVATAKAKSKIQAIIKREQREKQRLGEEQLRQFFGQNQKEPNSILLDRLCALHGLKHREELYAAIGSGHVVLSEADREAILAKHPAKGKKWSRYLGLGFLKRNRNKEGDPTHTPTESSKIDRKKPLWLNEETMAHYGLCPDCHPIPGDDVLGIVDDDNQITIHKRQCPIAVKMKASYGHRILAANWDTHKQLFFPATLHIEGIDNMGVLHHITAVLSQQMNVNMRKVHIEAHNGIFQAEIQMEVHDAEDLHQICRDLKKIPEVEMVNRF